MSTGTQYKPPTEEDWYSSLREREAQDIDNNPIISDEEAALDQQTRQPAHNLATTSAKSSRLQKLTVNLRGNLSKSPIVVILALLFGGGGIFTAMLAPGVTLLSLADTLERDLNSQLSAMSKTTDQLWRTKLKPTTSGSCGAVTLRCKFKSVNTERFDKAVARANATSGGHLQVVYDQDSGFGSGRKKIKEMVWTDKDGTKVLDAKGYADLSKSNIEFRKTMLMVYSPRFHAFKTQTTLNFLKKAKTSYAKKLKGKNEKEVRSSFEQARKGVATVEFTQARAILDEDGNETGRYEDPETKRELSPDEVERAKEQERRFANSQSTGKLLTNLGRGAMITGYIDMACTLYNTSRAVTAGAKILRAQELIRYSMIYTNEAHAIRAEMATPETVQLASSDIMHMEPRNQVADETKLAETPNGEKLPMIDNPNGGKTGMDSPIYKMSSSQDYPKQLDAQTQALMPGGGFTGTLSGINMAIANALGASEPKTISERCKIVQNPFVRGGALIIGIAAGIGTFGATTAASIGGSMLLAMALPYLTAQLADMAAGNATEGLKGMGAVSAISIGSGLMYNGVARSNGLMTMSPERMADYQNSKRESLMVYDEIDKAAARKNPLDVTNQFSFAGSLVRSSLPIAATIRSGGAGVLYALPQIASLATQSILPSANAADTRRTLVRPERYQMCDDPDYKELGKHVALDPTCVMIFGMPKEGMEADPEEVLEWMIANDEIILESETGEAKDNGRDWNYKKYLDQCVEQQPGAAEDPESNPTNGAGCTSEANFDKNWRYAKFKLALEVDLGIDGDLPGMEGGSEEDFGDGSTSEVGLDGWAYPTDKSATQVSSEFGMRGGTPHRGIDLAGPLGTPLYAAREGKVIAAGPASGFGNWIVIQHEVDGKRVDTVYGHMAANGVLVRRGDEVKAGQMIGRIGNEGQSTGPHLHFEVWDGGRSDVAGGNGEAINPRPILDKASSGSGDSRVDRRNL